MKDVPHLAYLVCSLSQKTVYIGGVTQLCFSLASTCLSAKGLHFSAFPLLLLALYNYNIKTEEHVVYVQNSQLHFSG